MTNVIVTAYCACALCCGELKPTASSAWPKEGVTIAAPRAIPLGTKVRVHFAPGSVWAQKWGTNHVFIVQDRTSRKYDGRFDVFMSSHKEALKFGKQHLNVELVH